MQQGRASIHSAQLEFYVQFSTLYFKKDEFVSENLKDREATSTRDSKKLIDKGKLGGWKGFLLNKAKIMALSHVEGSSKEEDVVLHDPCGWDKKEQAYIKLWKTKNGHESPGGDGKKNPSHHLFLIAGIA